MSLLVPKTAVKCADFAPVEAAVLFYNSILEPYKSDITVKLLKAEILQWCSFWEKREGEALPIPATAVESFIKCDDMFYPFIFGRARGCDLDNDALDITRKSGDRREP